MKLILAGAVLYFLMQKKGSESGAVGRLALPTVEPNFPTTAVAGWKQTFYPQRPRYYFKVEDTL